MVSVVLIIAICIGGFAFLSSSNKSLFEKYVKENNIENAISNNFSIDSSNIPAFDNESQDHINAAYKVLDVDNDNQYELAVLYVNPEQNDFSSKMSLLLEVVKKTESGFDSCSYSFDVVNILLIGKTEFIIYTVNDKLVLLMKNSVNGEGANLVYTDCVNTIDISELMNSENTSSSYMYYREKAIGICMN